MSRWAIYEWLSWGRFLAFDLFPGAPQVKARVDDDPAEILASLAPGTDGLVFHINCTFSRKFPVRRSELSALLSDRGFSLINARVCDISKLHIQHVCCESGARSTLCASEGDPEQLVIVKTNFNSGGTSEQQMNPRQREVTGLEEDLGPISNPDEYRVLPRCRVPDSWWTDRRLICERFVRNSRDLWYRLFFLGRRLVLCEFSNPAEIKKVGSSVLEAMVTLDLDQPQPGTVPVESKELNLVLRFRDAFALDFGAVDLVRDDRGHLYVIDVNTTPTYLNQFDGLVEFLRAPYASNGAAGSGP